MNPSRDVITHGKRACHIIQGAARVDSQGRYLTADDTYVRSFGHPPPDLIGSDWKSIIRPEDMAEAIRAYREMQVSDFGEFTSQGLTASGVGSPNRVLLIKDYDRQKVFSGHFCFIQGASVEGLSESGVREGEKIFHIALEDSPFGGLLVDPVCGFIRTNRTLREMLGYVGLELLGKELADITFSEDFDTSADLACQVVSGARSGYKLNTRILRKDGIALWSNLCARVIRNPNGLPIYAIVLVRDLVTAGEQGVAIREPAERIGPRYEARDSEFLDEGSDGFCFVDPTSKKILDASRLFLQMSGYSRSEITRFTLYDILSVRAEVVDSDIGEALSAQVFSIAERPLLRKDGSLIPVEVNSSSVYYSGVLVLRMAVRDISERKRLEEQLRHAVTMEALGRFAGGIAHDFNNLLVGVLGYSTMLEEKLRHNEPLLRMAHQITGVALRARELTAQILSISRRQVLPTEVLDINIVVKVAEGLLHRIIGEDIELVCDLYPALGRVRANPGQIDQVILNLAANSRDAMPGGGTLLLKTSDVHVDYALTSRFPSLVVGNYVLLTIRDTGAGMDAATLSHIFEPFYTTKEVGVGTGLGLSTAYGIIQQLGGCITVDSQLGRGTTFEIYLPRVEEQPSLFKPTESKTLPLASPIILVVEDEITVRSLIEDILKPEGYVVLSAENSQQALALVNEETRPIQLLITDIIMPGMLGPELATQLRKLRPDTRVLYMSGYSNQEIVRRVQLGDFEPFIQKPFTPQEFSDKVRETLNARKAAGDHL
jgi:two-component system, cell cycle sensor histidine kinase and response regulator CckA